MTSTIGSARSADIGVAFKAICVVEAVSTRRAFEVLLVMEHVND